MNYTDFSEDERKFYLSESGFDSREKEFMRKKHCLKQQRLWGIVQEPLTA